METWVGYVIAVFIGGLLTGGATILATYLQARREREERQREREEKYRLMLYEKRLEAHQRGFFLFEDLKDTLPDSIEGMNEAGVAAVDELECQVDEWWVSNRFYLDEESRRKIRVATRHVDNLVHDYGLPNDSPVDWNDHQRVLWRSDHNECLKSIENAVIALEKGIGMKHIEEPEKEQPEGKS